MENNQRDIMNKKILSKESHQGAGEKQMNTRSNSEGWYVNQTNVPSLCK